MGEQEVIMTKLALSVTLVALAALTASSTSSAPRAAWNPSADVAALLQTSADTAGEVKLSSSGAATYAMGIPQTGPGGYGTLPSATIPGSLPPANHPPVLGSPLLYGKDYLTPVNSARAQYPRTQWYSWPIVQDEHSDAQGLDRGSQIPCRGSRQERRKNSRSSFEGRAQAYRKYESADQCSVHAAGGSQASFQGSCAASSHQSLHDAAICTCHSSEYAGGCAGSPSTAGRLHGAVFDLSGSHLKHD